MQMDENDSFRLVDRATAAALFLGAIALSILVMHLERVAG
jgi:hypothetical protein